MNVSIIRAGSKDEDDVFEFLRHNYYPDEPLNVAVKRAPPTDKAECPALGNLKQNVSFLAVDPDNPKAIRAVCINGETKREENPLSLDELLHKHKNKVYGKILNIAVYVYAVLKKELEMRWKGSNNEADTAFDVTLISVGKEYRRRNLANQLMEKTIELAKERGHKWMTIECSSTYSAALAEKFGFEVVHEFLYDDYKDNTGHIVFKTPPPHDRFKILIKSF